MERTLRSLGPFGVQEPAEDDRRAAGGIGASTAVSAVIVIAHLLPPQGRRTRCCHESIP